MTLCLGGLVLSVVVVLSIRGGNPASWRSVSRYVLVGGFYGVVIPATYSFSVPGISLAATVALAVVAQLILSAIHDHHGFLGSVRRTFDLCRRIGTLVSFSGTSLIVR